MRTAAKNDTASLVRHTLINIMIVALIVCMYYVMSTPETVEVFNSNITYRIDDEKRVGMECIVAWNSEYLTDILDILKDKDTKITFVVSGEFCKENEKQFERMLSEGHIIATCGMNFEDASKLSANELADSIDEAVLVIKSAGAQAEYFYLPTNDTNKATRAADKVNMPCVRCTYDLLTARGDETEIVERARISAKPCAIIAFTPTVNAAKALPDVLAVYRENNLLVSPVTCADN